MKSSTKTIMNPEEIKVGETYNVRVRVDEKIAGGSFLCASVAPNGRALAACVYMPHEAGAFSPINPYPPLNLPITTEIPEPAPKYDPCRKFKKGDKAREILVKGRRYDARYRECRLGEIATVEKEESPYNLVTIRFADGKQYSYDAAYLELVTPVEELEPYFVQENQNVVEVLSIEDKEVPATVFFKSKHKNARERAEAERDRLNDEWRKEQK